MRTWLTCYWRSLVLLAVGMFFVVRAPLGMSPIVHAAWVLAFGFLAGERYMQARCRRGRCPAKDLSDWSPMMKIVR